MTDSKIIMGELRETLRLIDPEFFDTEVKYLEAASNLEKELGGSITPSVSEFLAAREEEFAAEIIYIGWQGFQLNIDIFDAPVNAKMLRGDCGELYQERRLGTLPMAHKARETINAFHDAMQKNHTEKMDLIEDITSFYSYLQTSGYKIAHYFGFRLADQFLSYVIPGYTNNSADTLYYKSNLEKYLQINIGCLEK